jgi:hypothetical protein
MVAKLYFTSESLGTAPTDRKVDREKGIVYGVRVVGSVSRNKRLYPVTVQRAAVNTYEGRVVNWDHTKRPDTERQTADRFGVIRNVRIVGDATYADLHFNPHHARANEFLWACENAPETLALSHHARVDWEPSRDAKGNQIARRILEVASVDIVADGGTNKSIFESLESKSMDEILASITDVAALNTFLADLFDGLTLSPEDKMAAVEELMASMDTEEVPTEAEGEEMAVAVEGLKRRGKLGQWAYEQVTAATRAKAVAARTAWAKEQCKKAGLSAEFVTETFLRAVVSLPDDMATALITERAASFKSAKIPQLPAGGTSRNSPSGASPKSVAELAKAASFS